LTIELKFKLCDGSFELLTWSIQPIRVSIRRDMVFSPTNQKDTQMSEVAIATPIAPSHRAGVGTAKAGGHIQVFRAQSAFPVEATLTVTGGNMWRPGTPGRRFYAEVLSQNPATVQEAIDKAAALTEPFNAKQVQAHLRWMFTSAGGFLEVDGQRYSSPAAPVKKPAKSKETSPAKKPAKKSKGES
jgi:hypothetical protein